MIQNVITSDDRVKSLTQSRQNIIDKNFKLMFFITESEIPSAAVYEIYNQVRVLRKYGYDAKILVDTKDYKMPDWIDDDMKTLPHQHSEGETFTISPEDFVIIPELFTNVMEQVRKLPCEKIVVLQNFENTLRGLTPGVTWNGLGIRNVITTNPKLTELANSLLGRFDVKEYTVGIPDYFKESSKPKKLALQYYTRNAQEMAKVAKLFYLKYPMYSFVTFEDLRGLKREDFAKKMSESFACLWLDRYSSFGLTAFEAMRCKTIPIGIVPDIMPDYISNDIDNGFWTNDIMRMPDLIAECIKLWIQDQIPQKVYDDMNATSEKYSQKESDKSIIETYSYFFEKRMNEINTHVNSLKESEQLTETK